MVSNFLLEIGAERGWGGGRNYRTIRCTGGAQAFLKN